MPNGILRVYTTVAGQAAPLAGVVVTIWDETGSQQARVLTDENGASGDIVLEAPDRALSLDEANTKVRPYAVYRLTAALAGWQSRTIDGVQIFDGQAAVARLELLPGDIALAGVQQDTVQIPEHPLFVGGGSRAPTPEDNGLTPAVLSDVVIPRTVTVHLGGADLLRPQRDGGLSGIYRQRCLQRGLPHLAGAGPPRQHSGPDQSGPQPHLDRVVSQPRLHLQHHRVAGLRPGLRGTAAPSFARHGAAHRRAVYHLRTAHRRCRSPTFAEYCDGKSVTCAGMKQWGTVDRANEGKTALQILRYYYGDRRSSWPPAQQPGLHPGQLPRRRPCG